MRLWIDDVRPAPNSDDTTVRTTNVAMDLIEEDYHIYFINPKSCVGLIVDLDHDAGKYAYDGGDYIEILNKLERLFHGDDKWKSYINRRLRFHIHSMNPVGVENMRRIIQRNGWKEI